MAQVPLPPPPQTGQPIDNWLYLLWRRLTQAGQILWGTITPGTSADVAAVVTDETGSPGSLVFSGNPTLEGVTVAGDILLTGTARRIKGDFSNATVTNRVIFQTSTTDGFSVFELIPNGTSQTASILISNSSSDPDNCSLANLLINGSEMRVQSAKRGSGTYLPMSFYANGTEQAQITVGGVFTAGGLSTAPALKVTPVASQARWIEVTGATSSTDPTIGTSGGNLACSAVFMPKQATTAGAPTYIKGGMYFDTTLNKLRIGGATAWETVTSI